MAIPVFEASTVLEDTEVAVEKERQAYLKRLPPVVELAEKRSVVQAQWAISATCLVIVAGLALWGRAPEEGTFLYRLLDELIVLICIVLFIGLAVNLYQRGTDRSMNVRVPFGPLLLSSAAFWIWMAIIEEAFVPPVDMETLFIYVASAGFVLGVCCAVLGLIYLIGRMLRPGEKKEIN